MKNKKIEITADNFGELLLQSANEALDHSKGKITLKTSSFEIPGEPPKYTKSRIKNIRESLLEVSQPVFASILACSPSTVKSWEIGQNKPNPTARRLLQLIERDPTSFLNSLSDSK